MKNFGKKLVSAVLVIVMAYGVMAAMPFSAFAAAAKITPAANSSDKIQSISVSYNKDVIIGVNTWWWEGDEEEPACGGVNLDMDALTITLRFNDGHEETYSGAEIETLGIGDFWIDPTYTKPTPGTIVLIGKYDQYSEESYPEKSAQFTVNMVAFGDSEYLALAQPAPFRTDITIPANSGTKVYRFVAPSFSVSFMDGMPTAVVDSQGNQAEDGGSGGNDHVYHGYGDLKAGETYYAVFENNTQKRVMQILPWHPRLYEPNDVPGVSFGGTPSLTKVQTNVAAEFPGEATTLWDVWHAESTSTSPEGIEYFGLISSNISQTFIALYAIKMTNYSIQTSWGGAILDTVNNPAPDIRLEAGQKLSWFHEYNSIGCPHGIWEGGTITKGFDIYVPVGQSIAFDEDYNIVDAAAGEHTHGWSAWSTTKKPTCTAAGTQTRTCAICNEKETKTIAKLGHDNGKWKTVTAATATKDGKRELRCTRCNALLKSEVLKKNPTIKLNLSAVTLAVKETVTPKATLSASIAVTWSSKNSAVAKVDAKTGKITAVKAGTTTVTAKTAMGKTASVTVTVKAAPTSIKASPASVTLGVKETYTIKTSVNSGAASYKKTYKSGNTAVATVDANGKVTAKKAGTASITVTAFNGKKTTFKVTVKPAPTSIKASPASVTLGVKETYSIKTSVNSGAASYKKTYKSGNTAVATVDANGKITAKKAGTATITVTAFNGKKTTFKVTVKAAPTSVKLNSTKLTLTKGKTSALKVTLNPSGAARSEERRVEKECRSRWSPYH